MIRSFLKKTLSGIHNVVFYRIFFIFIIAITIPVISISLLSIRHSTDIIMEHVQKSSINSLADRKNIIEQKVKEIEGIVYQVFNNKHLRKLQRSNAPTTDEHIIMSDFLKDLDGINIANELIDSVYVYDIKKEYIMYDSKYGIEDFVDPDAIEAAMGKEYRILRRRINNTDTITCTYTLRNVINGSDNIIIANVNYNNLFNLDKNQPSGIFNTLIFDNEYSEILLDSENLSFVNNEIIRAISNAKDTAGLYPINGKDYFACKVHSDSLGWTFVYLQPYSDVLQETGFIKKITVSSLIIVLLLSFVLAYIYSMYIYKPIDRLAKKVMEKTTNIPEKMGNAYKSIDDAIIKLFNKNTELMSRYQAILPSFKQYSVNDLLSGEMFDLDKFTGILNLLGIRFVYSRYVNIVIDIESMSSAENGRELIESVLSGFKTEVTYIIFNINRFRAAMIINTEIHEQKIYNLMEAIKQKLNDNSIEVTIAVGNLYDDISKAYSQHREVLSLIRDKFFAGKYQIILNKDKRRGGKGYVYDKKLEKELISCILQSQDIGSAVSTLNHLIDKTSSTGSSIEYIRYVYFQVISHIMESLDDIGIDPGKIELSREEIFISIQGSDTINNLTEFAESIIAKCVALINECKNAQHEIIVEKALEFLKLNFMKDISLRDVAGEVFLSPGYVNSMFRTTTGYTIYEYITKIRMETAAALLTDNSLKIQDISDRIGYNNIQSFFRLFKQYYNMTPHEYRLKLL